MNEARESLLKDLEAKQRELQEIVQKADITAEDTQRGLALKAEMEAAKQKIQQISELTNFAGSAATFIRQPASTSPHADVQPLGVAPAGVVSVDGDSARDENGLSSRQMKAIGTSDYMRAFGQYLRSKGDFGRIGRVEQKYLSEGVDADGGYLVPSEWINRLVQKKPTPTNIAQYTTQFQTSRDAVIMPKVVYGTDDLYTTGMRVVWTGEVPASATAHLQGTAAGTAQPQFGTIQIPVYTAMMSLNVTNNLIEDSAFNLDEWVAAKFSETQDLVIDNMILNGTGIGQPAGILLNPGGTDQPATVAVGAAGALVADSVAAAQWNIPDQYEGALRWVVNKTNFGRAVRVLKDSVGRYLFGFGFDTTRDLTGMLPATAMLDGLPVVWSGFAPNIPASGTAANVGVIGDLAGYYLVRRMGMSVQVLREINALSNQVTLLGRVRFGGAVAEPWRMKALNVAAS